MGFSAKVGSFNIDTAKTAGQTQSVTSVGFTPKVVLFWWSGATGSSDAVTGEDIDMGFGAMSAADARWALYNGSDDANASSIAGRNLTDAGCILSCLNGFGGTEDGRADCASLDADGFTLTIDNQFSTALRVSYLALGGDDLTNVYVGSNARDADTGNHAVTGVGFQPDALIVVYSWNVIPGSANNAAIFSLGMATGSSNQGVVGWGSYGAQATTITYGYGYNGEVVGAMYNDAVAHRDAFVSFDADGFTLNQLEGTSTSALAFVCLKGGEYSVGDIVTGQMVMILQRRLDFSRLLFYLQVRTGHYRLRTRRQRMGGYQLAQQHRHRLVPCKQYRTKII